MKMLNPIHHAEPFEKVATRLLVMPQDTGISFTIVNASRMRPEMKFSILRSHFEPWRNGDIATVQDRELADTVEAGCQRIRGDDHDISELRFNFVSGVRTMDFNEVCVCMPSAWSSIGSCGLRQTGNPEGKRRYVYKEPRAKQLNTKVLTDLREDAYCLACIDATAAYQVDDGIWLQETPVGQRYRHISYCTGFIFANRDRVKAIEDGLQRVWETPCTVWTSDFSPLSHLMDEAGSVLVDIDKHSVRIHLVSGSTITALHRQGFGCSDFLPRLSARLGEMPFLGEGIDEANRKLFADMVGEGLSPSAADLELRPTRNCTAKMIQKAVEDEASAFWDGLLAEIEKKTAPSGGGSGPRHIIVTGDSPTTLLSLCRAAEERHWSAELKWPAARMPEGRPSMERQPEPSARATFRAIELFHRKPFEGVPLGSQSLYRTVDLLKRAGNMAGHSVVFLLCAASTALVEKMARRM